MQQPRNLYEAVIMLDSLKKTPPAPPAPQASGLTEAERQTIIEAVQEALKAIRNEGSGTR